MPLLRVVCQEGVNPSAFSLVSKEVSFTLGSSLLASSLLLMLSWVLHVLKRCCLHGGPSSKVEGIAIKLSLNSTRPEKSTTWLLCGFYSVRQSSMFYGH